MSEELFDKDHFVSSFNKKIKKLMPDENDEIYEYLCLYYYIIFYKLIQI